ncbi:TraB/GumN family protein [Lysobacter olei]
MPVNGLKAGPGLWQVRKGGNTLWIFGTVSPIPKGLEWYSPQAERALARSTQIIGAPSVGVSVGMGGMFRAAFAMPTLLKARKNPDGKTLREVLPAPLYARWSQLRQQYVPKDDDIEEFRPSYAASKLYAAALERAGLVPAGAVYERIGAVVKKHDVERVSTSVKTEVRDVKGVAKTVIRSKVDETECLREVLDALERDVTQATLRANAWAEGDVATLTALSERGSQRACDDTFFASEVAAELGLADGRARAEGQWLKAVDTALERNHDTFAVLSVSSMLGDTGWLARLRARGYEVVAPE